MPTQPPSVPEAAGPEASGPDFEAFYRASRRRLVLETYALTGDLAASRRAVSDAFVAARQHWGKVSRLPDPEEWVRPRAWAKAQRRHVARLWRREKGLDAGQRRVLDALHHLPDQQRRVLLLTHLASLGPAEIARELGETPERVEEQLAAATSGFTGRAGSPGGVTGALESLAPVVEAVELPDTDAVHRSGRRRRRTQAAAGLVVALALVLVAGAFVVRDTDGPAVVRVPAEKNPVDRDTLLSLSQVDTLAPAERWQLVSTTDNTTGTGINSVCQTTRFADPRGRGTLVRTFSSPGTRHRNYLETVEISRSPRAAAAAYQTTLGWFAGCTEARLQLLGAYRLTGLGEQAQLLTLRIPDDVRRTYVVGLARTGSLTVSTVLETLNGRPVPVPRVVAALTDAVRNVCRTDPAGTCPTVVTTAPVLPPPSGETRGTLAAADLPVVGKVDKPWVGTAPVAARPNVAATTCDKADFVKAGSPGAATRTFLIPQAKLPMRFGITETYGEFATPARADALVRRVSTAMATCEKRDLGAKVSRQVGEDRGYRGSEYAFWRLSSEIDAKTSVSFWMGVTRVGRYVAQVNFTPTGADDIDEVTFQALLTRARDRLFELVTS